MEDLNCWKDWRALRRFVAKEAVPALPGGEEYRLADQPRGKEHEYRVIVANKAGDGEPSNTVMVVL